MKKSTIILIAIGALFLLFCGVGCSKYNGMVRGDQAVKKAWSDVEAAYQLRSDAVGNLVETVKGASSYEASTLQAVTDARAKAGSVTLNADDLSEEQLKKFAAAQDNVMKSLLAVSEAYPELKATDAYMKFMDDYSGMEYRIKVARTDYNKVAEEFNNTVVTFPNNIFAAFFGFKEKPYFSASEGAENAPQVHF